MQQVKDLDFRTVDWQKGKIKIIDQTRIPRQKVFHYLFTAQDAAKAIKEMQVRGAPAIGVVAALAMILVAIQTKAKTAEALLAELEKEGEFLKSTRPTAVNLAWGVERVINFVKKMKKGSSLAVIKMELEDLAPKIVEEDLAINKKIGQVGLEIVPDEAKILTHCNAGALASVGWGTALGVIRSAWQAGKKIEVYADETRPRLQGAFLTAWEMVEAGIPVTVVTDNMSGFLMQRKMVDLVIVGADRIAANGDTANKIGTYNLAVLAKVHKIPFYVAAPASTIDMAMASGKKIVIEERAPEEVTHILGQRIPPPGVKIINPAFDVTPADLITGIITEKGLIEQPLAKNLEAHFS